MGEGILKWVGAGVLAAGLTAGMVAGAGLAGATDGSTSDGGGSTTSEPSNSAETTPASTGAAAADSPTEGAEGSDATDPDADAEVPAEAAAEEPAQEPPAEEQPTEEAPAEEEPAADHPAQPVEAAHQTAAQDGAEHNRAGESTEKLSQPTATLGNNVTDESEPELKTGVTPDIHDTAATTEEPADEPADEPAAASTTVVVDTVVDKDAPNVEAVAFASAPLAAAVNATATAPRIPAIIRVLGTIVFNLYAMATRLLGGPPILPANSTVTVRSSSLRLDCGCNGGDGIEVPADWYIPAGAQDNPPDRLIYLQHGFLASGPWYSYTAAVLAEKTGSIVVAPSITSNFFAADACWLGAAPMHQAMAHLFDDGNTALADSAVAAGYSGPIPDRVVLMGHSLGGGAVAGIAGYMTDYLTDDRLAGVVLLDGVGLDPSGAMAASLKKVDEDIPIYQLASPKYFWNQFGVGTDALLEARPNQFIGVTLVGGSHVDTMRGGNPFIQFAQQFVSGFSKRQNVAAAQTLMVGWVNDMFDPTQKTGIYLEPGEAFKLATPAGTATLVDLPNSLTKPFLLNLLQPFMALANGLFTFQPVCATASITTASSSCTGSVAA